MNKNNTDEKIRQLLLEEKETAHIYYVYEDIIKSIMDAEDADMHFIPLDKWLTGFKPVGLIAAFTEEQKTVVEKLKKDAIRFANILHFTIKDDNGCYLKDNCI